MRKNVIRRGSRTLFLTVVALMLEGVSPVAAQETLRPLTPAGRLRLGVTPVYLAWSSRFGEDGSEPLGSVLEDPSGARLFPALVTLQETLRDLLADPGYEPQLGSSRAEVSASRIRVPMRAEIGIFDWLTAGITVPLVQNRTEVEFAFRADSATANVGLNPAIARPSEVLSLSDELGQRLAAASSRVDALCAANPSSPECAAARQLAEDGVRLVSGLRSAYAASPFFPLGTSAVGDALRQRLAAFNQGLSAQGLTPVSRTLLFAAARLSAADVDQLLSDAAVGINSVPLENRVGLWELGDLEAHVVLRLLERNPLSTNGAPSGLSYLVGAGALLRLGTGVIDNPDVFLDLPGGDGQNDLEARMFADLRYRRGGIWSEVRYGVQQSRTISRRVGPPDVVLVPAVNLADVEWTPGSYLEGELAPRFQLTDELSISGSYRFFHKGEDSFTRRSAPPTVPETSPLPFPIVFTDVEVLASGTEETLHQVGAGLFYSTWSPAQQGRALPLEGQLGVRWSMAGAGFTTPRGIQANAALRLFFRLWGG